MLWIKSLHIVFIASWFAGLFYLPRIFVNLALETNEAARARLLLMARKLYRFTLMLSVPAIAFGIVLTLYYGIGLQGPGNGWMHAKLVVVVLAIGYMHACGSLLKKFEHGAKAIGSVMAAGGDPLQRGGRFVNAQVTAGWRTALVIGEFLRGRRPHISDS